MVQTIVNFHTFEISRFLYEQLIRYLVFNFLAQLIILFFYEFSNCGHIIVNIFKFRYNLMWDHVKYLFLNYSRGFNFMISNVYK